jgi:NTE family protein
MHLVLGPGAMGLYAYLGAISAINTDDVEEVSGCSAGSILGLFLCCGKTLDEIRDFVFGVDLKELSKVNIVSLIKNFGLISHTPIKKVLRQFVGDPKFKDLKKKLYVTSYCINKMETEYFSADNSPDMSVVDAVSMSMSVPFLFETIKYRDYTYVDGSVRECTPMLAFLHKDPKDVLVIKLEKNKHYVQEIKNLKDFVMCLVNIATESTITYSSLSKEISLDVSGFDVFDFSMSEEAKMKMYLQGYQTTLSHLGSFR